MKVGFVGLGNMGEGMAGNLLRGGFDVVVRDVRPEVVERLVAQGASAGSSNAEVGRDTEAVFLAVFDDKQVMDVAIGSDVDPGALSTMAPGSALVVHSTVSRQTHLKLAEAAAERGVDVLDASMTGGGDVAAREGTLTFFVGGDASTLDRLRPALETMARNIFHVGGLGAGSVAKVINNFLAVSHVSLVREAIRLTRAVGVDEDQLLRMIEAGGVGSSWVSNNWGRIREQEENYTTGKAGMVAMADKDLHLALELSTDTSTDMPILRFIVENVLPDLQRTGLTG